MKRLQGNKQGKHASDSSLGSGKCIITIKIHNFVLNLNVVNVKI